MKKLKLLTLLIVPAIAIPVALNLTSCALFGDVIREINVADYIPDQSGAAGKTYTSQKKVNVSLHSLLWGTKSFNNGNYILFISHSSYSDSMAYLLGNPPFGLDNPEPALTNIDTNLPAGILACDTINDNDIAIVSYILFDKNATAEIYGTGDRNVPEYHKYDPVSPFAKWGTEDEIDNEDHTNGDYVRNDRDAKKYRSVISTISTIYKLDAGAANNFIGVQAVKGKIIGDSGSIITSGFLTANAFDKWVSTNWDIGKDLK